MDPYENHIAAEMKASAKRLPDKSKRDPSPSPKEPAMKVDEKVVEAACRAFYGERWERMNHHLDSPRNWMRAAIEAILPLLTPQPQVPSISVDGAGVVIHPKMGSVDTNIAMLAECYEWLFDSKSDGPRVSEGAIEKGYFTPAFLDLHNRLKSMLAAHQPAATPPQHEGAE